MTRPREPRTREPEGAPPIRWVVRPGDGDTVAEVAARAGADRQAIEEGRVFVGRARATDGAASVRPGDVVAIAPRRPAPAPARILVDEDGIVGVDKPAGIPTIPDHGGAAHSLLAAVAATLGRDPSTLHPTSRLDRDVSGVVLFARTRDAAERLAAARREGRYARRYVAIAGRAPDPPHGAWAAAIGRAPDPRRRVALDAKGRREDGSGGGRDPIPARSVYEVVARAAPSALLALEPITGRTHQLRVHAAHAGAALLGDATYGGAARVVVPGGKVLALRRVALHAARVIVPRAAGGALEVRAEIPEELRALWRALGGADDAWERALDAPMTG